MNKKTYIKPEMTVIDMDTVAMIASSTPKIGIVNPDEEEGSGDEMLGNDRRGNWGNLWNE